MASWTEDGYFPVTWTLVLCAIVLYLAYDWWCHQFFQRAGIPVAPYYPVVGNAIQWLTKGGNNFAEECVQKYGKVVGMYRLRYPILCVTDADIVKRILVTDYNKFPSKWKIPAAGFPLNQALMFMTGEKWRDVRGILTPSFTTSKLRQMVGIFNDCCDPLLTNLDKSHRQDEPLNCKRVCLAFIVQSVVAVLFGLDVQCQADLDHPFVTKVEKAFQPTIFTLIPIMFPSLGPIFELMGANIFSKDAIDFFLNTIKDSTAEGDLNKIRQRMGVGAKQYVTMIELFLKNTELPGEMKKLEETGVRDSKKLSYKEFLSSVVTLLAGGNEATTTLLQCTMYALALNPEIQDRVIDEIDKEVPDSEDINYDTVASLSYLDMVISETFRMYPPEIMTDRVCSETVTYGKYTIRQGTLVNIPFYPIHHDEELWPDPEIFDPERFSPERKDANNAYGWVSFGGGPRICIAVKFVTIMAKVLLSRALQKYRFEPCPETPIPLKFKKRTMLEPDNVFVRVVPRIKSTK